MRIPSILLLFLIIVFLMVIMIIGKMLMMKAVVVNICGGRIRMIIWKWWKWTHVARCPVCEFRLTHCCLKHLSSNIHKLAGCQDADGFCI